MLKSVSDNLYTLQLLDSNNKAVYDSELLQNKIDATELFKLPLQMICKTLCARRVSKLTISFHTTPEENENISIDLGRGNMCIVVLNMHNYFSKIIFQKKNDEIFEEEKSDNDLSQLKNRIYGFSIVLYRELYGYNSILNQVQKKNFCHHVFFSGTYGACLGQLKNHLLARKACYPTISEPCDSILESLKPAVNLWKAIFDQQIDDFSLLKDFHKKLFLSLRALLNKKTDLVEVKLFLNDITSCLFSNLDLKSSSSALLSKFIPKLDSLRFNVFSDTLPVVYDALRLNSELSGTVNEFTDHILAGNLPTLLWEEEMFGKPTKFFRVPNVTRVVHKDDVPHIMLLEEWKNFVMRCAHDGVKILYVNMMKTREVLIGDLEWLMSSAIHDMETKLEYHTFSFLSMDRSSNTYFFKNTIHVNTLKELILGDLFDSMADQPYVWPLGTSLEEWESTCEKIIDDILSHYFAGVTYFNFELTPVLRDMMNVILLDKQIGRLHPAFVYFACQASVDRAPSFYVLFYLYQKVKKRQLVTPQEIQNMISMFLTHALLAFNRAVHNERVKILSDAVQLFLSKPPLE